MATPAAREPLLTGEQVSSWVGMTTSALSQMRHRGTGPKYRKLGARTIRYAESDVQAWIDASERIGTAQEAV